MRRISIPGTGDMWSIAYGWGWAARYALALHGSEVVGRFVGPGAIQRAHRWINRSMAL